MDKILPILIFWQPYMRPQSSTATDERVGEQLHGNTVLTARNGKA
jgi:hypothetical protein